jgi:hypothetical protein
MKDIQFRLFLFSARVGLIVSFKKNQQLKMRLTIIRKSACVPVNTGISMGTLTVYGLFNRTPKFLSPLIIFCG